MTSTPPAGNTPATTGSVPAQPPPGFKFIKVRKPDGTIVTVKKKLTPEELEKQHNAQAAAPASAVTTDATTDATEKKATEFKIITVRMPDGTLAKVKRPIQPGETEKPAAAPAQTPTSKPDDSEKETPATASPNPTPDEIAALREQQLANKHHRRSRFKHALLFGFIGAAGSTLPDLVDGDEIVSDSDFSDDELDDEHHDDEASSQTTDPKEQGDSSSMAPVAAAGAAGVAAGMLVAGAMAGPPPTQPPPVAQPNGQQKTNGKEGYRVTVKDLNELDEKAEKRTETETPLERRWAAFSFYFLASLSIVLPICFVVLAGFIVGMEGKSTDSNWSKIEDPIKIAITVWPIVFAAVTAQAFKTWAAYKVERGIKLMELEQLVGSSSFGAVMKQPFVLRRLDMLTLGIFIIWALSPIGSQALQRAYSLKRDMVIDTAPVLYQPMLGRNTLLSPGEPDRTPNELAELWQAASLLYMGALMPSGVMIQNSETKWDQDLYNHPVPKFVKGFYGGSEDAASMYGLPVVLDEAMVSKLESTSQTEESEKEKKDQKSTEDLMPFENITFPVTSSFYNFTCQPWRTLDLAALEATNTSFSHAETMAIRFSSSVPDTSIDQMTFATLLNITAHNQTSFFDQFNPDPAWVYGVLDCSFAQIFYNATVECFIDGKSGTRAFNCRMSNTKYLPDSEIDSEWRTELQDFAEEFVKGANPYPVLFPFTPTEKMIFGYSHTDGHYADFSQMESHDPDSFAYQFSILFNTFLTVTHCPFCISTTSLSLISPALVGIDAEYEGYEPFPEQKQYIKPAVDAVRVYSPPAPIYELDWRWVAVFLTCVIILLLTGIASVALESVLVAPDVLGYASTLARNSRYLHLPKHAAKPMSGPERARVIGGVNVMIQDVKPEKDVGKIALGLKHERAERVKPGRLYR